MSKKIYWISLAFLAATFFLAAGFVAAPTTEAPSEKKKVEIGTKVGDQAPEIEMADVNGKTIKLSDLRGKIVLIDFWASWCGPCRRENPNVVEAYDKYKGAKFHEAKGFEILSVSLDKDQKRWEQAIKKDGLAWQNHVSDLQGWQNAAAATYGVRGIPASFLVDADGIIIARNLRGLKLHTELDKLVKRFKK